MPNTSNDKEVSFTDNAAAVLKNGTHKIDQSSTGVTKKVKIDIGYRFPETVRPYRFNGKTYGTKGMRYSDLYEILCVHFNGRYFIEDYFARYLKPHFSKEIQNTKKIIHKEIKREISFIQKATRITKKGALDKRYTIGNKRLQDFKFWKATLIKDHFNRLAKDIKKDIIRCLANGKIPLFHSNTPETKEKKEKIFGSSGETFYASGKLIESIKILFKMEVA